MEDKNQQLYQYPSELVTDEVKNTNEWGMQYLKAFWSEWQSNAYFPIRNRTVKIMRNRTYAEGQQDNNQYKTSFDTGPKQPIYAPDGSVMTNASSSANPEWVNLNWEVISPIPKIVNRLLGYFARFGENMEANAIDPISVERARDYRYQLEAKAEQKDFLDTLDVIQPMDQKRQEEPQTPEEIELFMRMNYKQKCEIMGEEFMTWLDYTNQFDERVKPEILRDLIVDGWAGDYDYRGANGKICVERLDTIDCGFGYSRKKDFSDINKWFKIKRITIAQLKEEAGDTFTEEQYKEIAQKAGSNTNYPINWSGILLPDPVYGNYIYDKVSIEVMFCEFITTNTRYFEKKYNKQGKLYSVGQVSSSYEVDERDTSKREKKGTTVQVKYSGNWIVGTEYMYGYGVAEDMRRAQLPDGKISADTMLSARFFRPNLTSIVERLIPHEDELMLLWMKLQNAIARARPKGLSIELSGLEGITVDGKEWSPLHVIALYDQTGNLIWRDTAEPGATREPIRELENGLGAEVQQYINLINFNVSMMRELAGLNEAEDSSTPNPNLPVGLANAAINSTGNALRPIYDAFLYIKNSTFRSMLNRGQLQAKMGDIEGYIPMFGENRMKHFKVTSEMSEAELGIMISAKPTEQEKLIFEQRIQAALTAKDITMADVLAIDRLTNTSIKYAEQLLTLRIEKRRKQAAQEQQQMLVTKGQTDQQSAMAAAQAKQQLEAASDQRAMQKMLLEYKLKAELDNIMTDNKLRLAEAVAGDKAMQTVVEAAADRGFSKEGGQQAAAQ